MAYLALIKVGDGWLVNFGGDGRGSVENVLKAWAVAVIAGHAAKQNYVGVSNFKTHAVIGVIQIWHFTLEWMNCVKSKQYLKICRTYGTPCWLKKMWNFDARKWKHSLVYLDDELPVIIWSWEVFLGVEEFCKGKMTLWYLERLSPSIPKAGELKWRLKAVHKWRHGHGRRFQWFCGYSDDGVRVCQILTKLVWRHLWTTP